MSLLDSREVYQGQFGLFTITDRDRLGVRIYRGSLAIAALTFAVGSFACLWQPEAVIPWLTPLYWLFSLALGVALLTVHIYLRSLHQLLQLFWAIGTVAAVVLAWQSEPPLAMVVYEQPLTLLGMGFTFAALTGIFFKEGFCFDRLETKLLTPLVPFLLLGHLAGFLPVSVERGLLAAWSVLFFVFALRKAFQAIPDDIGDKSVFEYLAKERHSHSS